MHHLNFLIKPASSSCNMRCEYCFYEDVSSHRSVKNYGFMSLDTAEALIRSAFSSVDSGGEIMFAFQGGEPTLIGLSFFQSFVDLEHRHAKPGVTVHHAIQTNGSLLDASWAQFFHNNDFLVGLSIDGTKEIHDLYRLDASRTGTWKSSTKALKILQKHQVEVNILCVVTTQCARFPQKVYQSLKKLGVNYLQFIPCMDAIDDARGDSPFSLSPSTYGSFLCGLFDAWYLDWKSGRYTSVRLFDDYIHLLIGQPPGSCATSGRCGSYLVVEGDGSLYPCDFYVLDEWLLGNIKDVFPADAHKCELAQQFLHEGANRPPMCKSCRWFHICRGGCKRDWHIENESVKNHFCGSYQQFFSYAYERLCEVAHAELRLLHQSRV